MPLDHSHSKSSFTNNVKTLMEEVGKSPHVQSRKQALAISYATEREPKRRAMGGVAPQQLANPGGMMSTAMNPSMGGGMGINPAMPIGQNPVGQPMAQPPINTQAMGVMPGAMMGQPNGLNAGMPGPAGARPFAFGGGVGASANAGPKMFKGPIVSAVPGRTDKHLTHVPSGSFVIPADIVSGHGEGNTLAGMNTLQKLFKMGGHSGNPSAIPGANSTIKKLAQGGSPSDKHVGKPVKVVLAGGEIVVPPENVHETMERICKKKMTLSECHKAMDAWVLKQRKKLRKTLAALPGPARD